METQTQNKAYSPIVGALCIGITAMIIAAVLSEAPGVFPAQGGMGQEARVVVISREDGHSAMAAKVPEAVETPLALPPTLSLSAAAHIAVFVSDEGRERVLFAENERTPRLLASVTKLMTSLVARESLRGYDEVVISQSALDQSWVSHLYAPGMTLFFKDALSAVLIASHNEIAAAVAERAGGYTSFVAAMNTKAAELGMHDTVFANPTGLDKEKDGDNMSTAHDIVILLRYITARYPDILAVSGRTMFPVFDRAGVLITEIESTNKLLSDSDVALPIIGGKTGETLRAQKNLAVVAQAPCGGRVYAVVLGSPDHFGDMKELLRSGAMVLGAECGAVKSEI